MSEALHASFSVVCAINCMGYYIVKDCNNGFVIDAGDKNALMEKNIMV